MDDKEYLKSLQESIMSEFWPAGIPTLGGVPLGDDGGAVLGPRARSILKKKCLGKYPDKKSESFKKCYEKEKRQKLKR
jgi:hypothetical protein